MLKIYISSVIIWMIIIYCAAKIFGPQIKNNGWTTTAKPTMGKWTTLFVVSAIPLLRLLVLSVFVYMALYTKEQYETIKKEREDND